MHSKLLALMLLGLGYAGSVLAVDIIPNKGVSLLVVNGNEADSKIGPSSLKLGENQVVVRVDKLIGSGGSKEHYTSAPYVLTFDASDTNIEISPPKLYSIDHANKVFKNKPEWRLTSAGKDIVYQSEILPKKDGLLPYSGLVEMVNEYNQKRGISYGVESVAFPVVMQSTEPVVKNNGKSKKQKQASASDHPKALEQLQVWYLKASQEDRKAFRKWMVDQD